jgi:hypothetical protein
MNIHNKSKIMQYVSITLLICMCILRLVQFVQEPTPVSMILTIYYLLFAVIMLCVELGLKYSRYQFYFLNVCWGKGTAAFFYAFTMFGNHKQSWMQIPIGAFFAITGVIYFIISICYKDFE